MRTLRLWRRSSCLYGRLLHRIRISGETARRVPYDPRRVAREPVGCKDAAVMVMLAPVLSPHGVLTLGRSLEADSALVLDAERGVRLEQALAPGSAHGLVVLGADDTETELA